MLNPSTYASKKAAFAITHYLGLHAVGVRWLYCLLLVCVSLQPAAQTPCKSLDIMLVRLTLVTIDLPADLKQASFKYAGEQAKLFDTIAALFESGAKELADAGGRRSALLNMYAGYGDSNVLPFSPLMVNQQLQDYFLKQGYKIESLDRTMNAFLKRPDRSAYKRLGYVGAYDSAYQKRLPQIKRYSAAVIGQVKEELRFLQAHQYLLKSTDEHVRINYLERYLTVLGRLLNLNSTVKRVVALDGAEIYSFCQQHPASCDNYAQ